MLKAGEPGTRSDLSGATLRPVPACMTYPRYSRCYYRPAPSAGGSGPRGAQT